MAHTLDTIQVNNDFTANPTSVAFFCNSKATALVLSIINTKSLPAVELNPAGQPVPQAFAITVVNAVAESADSLKYKVILPDAPKNLRLP